MVFPFVHQKATQTYSSFIYIIYETILYTAHADYASYLQSTTCTFK